MQNLITNTYQHQLANAYFKIDERGILTDSAKLDALGIDVKAAIKLKLEELSHEWSTHVYLGAANSASPNAALTSTLNLNSPSKVLEFLRQRGYKIPKVRKKNADTREIEYKESVEELAIRKMFSESPPDKAASLKLILDIRELNTLFTRYINAKRHNNIFYSCYNVAGTNTGRRSCKKNSFGLGGNAQNFPKHSNNPFVHRFRECLVARRDKILFFVDQKSAEDWPVSALAQNHRALEELRAGVNRHIKLASFIFTIPESSRSTKEWKDSLEYYLGKKTRHAANYRMQAQMMSDQLAKEGFSLDKKVCANMLERVHQYDPSIRQVFHQYVQSELFSKHKLTTPLGRERYFFGLRNNDDNHKILNEACAFIPQSTVGDNTGLSVLYLSSRNDYIIQECHDSICQELPDDYNELQRVFRETEKAFERDITFHNGITIRIPIEAEIGYDFKNTVTLKNYTEEDLKDAYSKLREAKNAERQQSEVTETVANSLP